MATPPRAVPGDTVHEAHGLSLPDPYAWLRTADWQGALRDPSRLEDSIRRHLEAENAYTSEMLQPVEPLRETLRQELRGRLQERDQDVPRPDGPYAYYRRYEEGRQHPLYCRRPRDAEGPEEVLLDGNAAALGQAFFRVGGWSHAPDHRYVAFALDLTGSEYHRLKVLDTATGELRDTGADSLAGDLAWAADGRTLFYTALDDNHRPSRLYRTRIGTAEADALVYEEPDPAFFLEVGRSEDRRYVVLSQHDHADTAEVRLIDADRPDAEPRLVRPRETGFDYRVSAHGERLVILTNADGALDYKIVTADAADPGVWTDLVPHRPGVLIKGMRLFRDHLVRLELADAQPRLVVRDLRDGSEHSVAPPEADAAHALGMVPSLEFDTAVLRFVYSSPRQPERTYDYDMDARTLTLRKEQRVPSGHDPEGYVVRRFTVPGRDGAEVPVTLLHRKDAPPAPGRPLLLYGYGAYGMAVPASFVPHRFSLVDRGMTYAIAHVRGGSDRGYRWYLDGKLAKKTNTFDDFLAAADGLVEAGMVRAGDIVANGRSAGGMLMGVIANRRPELFRAVVAEVPFVDVLNTMRDASLPLTPPEWSEWGNPLQDPEACRRMAGYSPYDNVRPQAYPHILATAGIADPRVTYWEPAKWIARLRAESTGEGKILLHTEMGAGHGGAAGRFARLDEIALVFAFILWASGLAQTPASAEVPA